MRTKLLKVGVEYSSRKKEHCIMDFKDEKDMINYGMDINSEIIIRKGTCWVWNQTIPDYVMEIYDDYRE